MVKLNTERQEERFGGNGPVDHFDCGNGFVSVHILQHLSNCTHYIYILHCLFIMLQ